MFFWFLWVWDFGIWIAVGWEWLVDLGSRYCG